MARDAGSGTVAILPELPDVPGKSSCVMTWNPTPSTSVELNAEKVKVSEPFNVIPLFGFDLQPAIPPGPELLLSVDHGPKFPVNPLLVAVRSLADESA
jgi:hypothetical protein